MLKVIENNYQKLYTVYIAYDFDFDFNYTWY
jgi:hypothetical protein